MVIWGEGMGSVVVERGGPSAATAASILPLFLPLFALVMMFKILLRPHGARAIFYEVANNTYVECRVEINNEFTYLVLVKSRLF